MIRIVGLSATLPNYLDVARFLNVNPYIGLFFFDGRFRPVPLGQTFIGIKTNNVMQQRRDMDFVCYEKVLELVDRGHQVDYLLDYVIYDCLVSLSRIKPVAHQHYLIITIRSDVIDDSRLGLCLSLIKQNLVVTDSPS